MRTFILETLGAVFIGAVLSLPLILDFILR
jgi:hypothetical protein